MKKRDLFWLNRILLIFFVGLTFVLVSIYNIVQFNNTYIQEEKKELEIFTKQIEWVIIPLLKQNDIQSLKKYANDFRNNAEFSFRIFDEDKNEIISSYEDLWKKPLKNDKRVGKKYNIWDLYVESFENKSLEKVSEININNKKYYLELSLSQEFVISTIIKAQKNIIFFFCICLLLLFFGIIHIFYSIRKGFNSLEDSVIQIARGNFDTEINLPKNGLLKELSLAIMRMTNRLKTQIVRLTQLEEYRKEFVSNMSHEIKTPITAINSAVELIEGNSEINDIQKECFGIIKSQTYSINRLVGDILTLSEIDLEKTNEHKNFKVFNLNNAINQAISIQPQEVIFNEQENIDILGNEELVITMISNLLSNAIKYSGSEKIEVNLISESNSRVHLNAPFSVIIEVKDYGVGIPAEHLPRIFERFYRVDKTRSRQSGGTGLGLAIVKHIVELHNWKIEVESEVGKGTNFRIII